MNVTSAACLSILLSQAPLTPVAAEAFAPSAAPTQDSDPVAEYEAMREKAGEDVDALWEVYDYCDAYGLEKQGRSVLRKIVDVDEENEKARKLLGHIYHDGLWFTSERKLEDYKRAEEERMAEEKGLGRFGDEWVPLEDLPKYEKGLVRLDDGRWVTAEVKEKIEKGWRQFDMGWYSPEDMQKIEEEGLYPCGDEWLPVAEADKYHSEISHWWQIPWDHFRINSTCSRETTEKALYEIERTYPDLKRIFGMDPAEMPLVILLNSQPQYNSFAARSPQTGLVSPETSGYSSFYYAFNCESWVDVDRGEHPGAACAFWDDMAENGNAWGPLAVRHAAGLAYAQTLDPSPRAVADRVANPMGQFDGAGFWAEKNLPIWMHYGAAAYVERYFIESGADNPLWAREWSASMIAGQGGLDELSSIFAFPVSADNPSSGKLVNQAGLLIAFVVDGKVPAVIEKHGALKHALRTGEGVRDAAHALQATIIEQEDKLRAFAGL